MALDFDLLSSNHGQNLNAVKWRIFLLIEKYKLKKNKQNKTKQEVFFWFTKKHFYLLFRYKIVGRKKY